jgi:hypothetical protein
MRESIQKEKEKHNTSPEKGKSEKTRKAAKGKPGRHARPGGTLRR